MKTIRMEEMNWPDVRGAIASGYDTAVVAVSSTEQHGPHLPTMTDTRIGDALAHRFALKLGNALQARTIPVGVSEHHLAFGATISLKPETLKLVIRDYVDSLARDGFRRVIFLPCHGGNFVPIAQAVEDARKAHPEMEIAAYTDMATFFRFCSETSAELGIAAEESGAHAGELETSVMMALEPTLVAHDRLAAGYLGPFGARETQILREKGTRALTENGVLGDPTRASAERGEVYLEKVTDFWLRSIQLVS
jgi:creatinine amidohydrolase